MRINTAIFILLSFSSFSRANDDSLNELICEKWGTPTQIGQLPPAIYESSGMVSSNQFANRLYHINDSGSNGEFFMTNSQGGDAKRIEIQNFLPLDTEDLALGPCGIDQCLYIADIGNNRHFRNQVEIVAIKEQRSFLSPTPIEANLKLKYPNGGRHDAEAIFIHPSGDLFIFSKDFKQLKLSAPTTHIFYIAATEMWTNPYPVKMLRRIGEIDLSEILQSPGGRETLVTAADIHTSGKRFTLLTYSKAIEFYLDLKELTQLHRHQRVKKLNQVRYSVIDLLNLRQQESLTYSKSQDAIIYSSEDRNAALIEVPCLKRQ